MIKKNEYKDNDCYFGFRFSVADGSAAGSQSWRDCTNASSCSGTYSTRITWRKPPPYLAPGKSVPMSATVKKSERNTCGSRGIISGLDIFGPGLKLDAGDTPTVNKDWTVPTGSPGQKFSLRIVVTAAGLQGELWYTYIYK